MNKILIFIVCFFVMTLVSTTASAEVPHIGSGETNRDYYYIGGDRVSLGVLRFKTEFWIDVSTIDREVNNARKMNFNWDDKWYYETLPDNTDELLVLFWKNHIGASIKNGCRNHE